MKCIFILLLALSSWQLLAKEKKYCPVQIGSVLYTQMEVVSNDEDRARGLMYRKELALDGGMLFLFNKEEVHSFWMRNTLIPLDIIFVNKKGVVVAIHTMKVEKPQSPSECDEAYCARLPSYSSKKPAIAAIEINAGMASEIKVGDVIHLPQN